jgi:hypothetical protein
MNADVFGLILLYTIAIGRRFFEIHKIGLEIVAKLGIMEVFPT